MRIIYYVPVPGIKIQHIVLVIEVMHCREPSEKTRTGQPPRLRQSENVVQHGEQANKTALKNSKKLFLSEETSIILFSDTYKIL